MRLHAAILAAAFLSAAPSVWAASPATTKSETVSTTAEATTAEGKDPDEIVCIRQQEADSRIPGKKECHSRRTWDQITEDSRQQLQDMQNRNQTLSQQRGG